MRSFVPRRQPVAPSVYRVAPGDRVTSITEAFGRPASAYGELVGANLDRPLTDAGCFPGSSVQFAALAAGETLSVPAHWLGAPRVAQSPTPYEAINEAPGEEGTPTAPDGGTELGPQPGFFCPPGKRYDVLAGLCRGPGGDSLPARGWPPPFGMKPLPQFGVIGAPAPDPLGDSIASALAASFKASGVSLGPAKGAALANAIEAWYRQAYPHATILLGAQGVASIDPFVKPAVLWWDTYGGKMSIAESAAIPWTEIPWLIIPFPQIPWALLDADAVRTALEGAVQPGMVQNPYTAIAYDSIGPLGWTQEPWINVPWTSVPFAEMPWALVPWSHIDFTSPALNPFAKGATFNRTTYTQAFISACLYALGISPDAAHAAMAKALPFYFSIPLSPAYVGSLQNAVTLPPLGFPLPGGGMKQQCPEGRYLDAKGRCAKAPVMVDHPPGGTQPPKGSGGVVQPPKGGVNPPPVTQTQDTSSNTGLYVGLAAAAAVAIAGIYFATKKR